MTEQDKNAYLLHYQDSAIQLDSGSTLRVRNFVTHDSYKDYEDGDWCACI
jgi:hypothetical protein